MEVNVGGRLDIGFFPSFHIAIEDVQIRNRGSEVASAAQASLGIALLPLLHREFRIDSVELKQVRMTIERQRDGKFNFETQSNLKGTVQLADTTKVSLSDVTLLYTDQQSGKGFEADSCDLDVSHLQRSEQEQATPLSSLSFTAGLACGIIRTSDVVMSDVKLSINGKEGIFDLNPITMHVFGGLGTGNIRADFSGSVPELPSATRCRRSALRILQDLVAKECGDGPMNFSANLSMKGVTKDEMVRSAAGEASLRGHDLALEIGDIDKELARYESSQNFNLVDVGALFFAGPLGLAVTKGFNFASIFQSSGGSSSSDLISNGASSAIAQAKMWPWRRKIRSPEGRVGFRQWAFREVTVAPVVQDAHGAAEGRGPLTAGSGKAERPDRLGQLSLLGGRSSLEEVRCVHRLGQHPLASPR
jgi:AsmA protein